MSTAAESAIWDPFAPELVDDPYPAYARLREEAPVYRVPGRDLWAISRYADVEAGLRDWRTFSSAQGVDIEGFGTHTGLTSFEEMDPPRHDALRKLLRDRFTPKGVRELKEATERVIAAVADEFLGQERIDLSEYAGRVSLDALCDAMGLDPQEGPERLSEVIALLNHREPGREDLPDEVFHGNELFGRYMDVELTKRHAGDRYDVIGIIASGETTGLIDRKEAIDMCGLVTFGALDTSTGSMSIAMHLLAEHPELRAALLRGDAELAPAFEECLRYDAPLQFLMRVTTGEAELHGVTIPAGRRVLFLQGAANRDPRKFDDPDRLDFDRPRSRHFAFGEGVHFCLGAPLSRLWGLTAVQHLLDRAPAYAIDGPVVRSPVPFSHGIDALPVRLRP